MTAVLAITLGLLPLPALFAPRGRWAGWLVAAVAVTWMGTAIATYMTLPHMQHGAIGEDEDIGAICAGELVALCRLEQGSLQPARVFRSPRKRITIQPKRREETGETADAVESPARSHTDA